MVRTGDTLVNPASGERIVFLQTAADTDGRLLEMDDFWTRPGHRTPEHIHPEMQERWEVIAGTASFCIAGDERTAGPGEVVIAPPGVPHLAWNPTDEPVHLRIQMRPALRGSSSSSGCSRSHATVTPASEACSDPTLIMELLREFPSEIAPVPSGGD